MLTTSKPQRSGLARRDFLFGATATALSGALGPARARVLSDVETIVLEGDILSGTIDAAPTLRSLIRSNRRIIVPPNATLLHSSVESQKPPQFAAVKTCIVVDGVTNFHLVGNGAKIRFNDVATAVGHKWLVFQTSNSAYNSSNFCRNVSVRNFNIEGGVSTDTRRDGWLVALQFSSVKDAIVEDIHLTGDWAGTGRSSFMQGDNLSGGQIRRISGSNIITAFDVSSWDNTIIENFNFDCEPSISQTGINIFYAPVASKINLPDREALPNYPANVTIRNGVLRGYKTGIAIDGQFGTLIDNVDIQGGLSNKSKEVPKGIFIYLTKKAFDVGRSTQQTTIKNCLIRGYRNNDGGHAAGIRIFNNKGLGPSSVKIYNNLICDNKDYGIQTGGDVDDLDMKENRFKCAETASPQTRNVYQNLSVPNGTDR